MAMENAPHSISSGALYPNSAGEAYNDLLKLNLRGHTSKERRRERGGRKWEGAREGRRRIRVRGADLRKIL